MSRQNPAERAEATRQRLDSRQKGLTTQLNNRTNTARTKLNARDSRQINQLVGDLTDLGPELPPPTLRKEEPRGPIPAARGYMERNQQPGLGEGAAGIAGPLTEAPGTREYHSEIWSTLYSSDYLLAVEIRPLMSLVMLDAEGREVKFNFALPPSME